jgi:hypothetical protein
MLAREPVEFGCHPEDGLAEPDDVAASVGLDSESLVADPQNHLQSNGPI